MDVQIRKTELSDSTEIHNLINDKEVIKELNGFSFPCSIEKIKKDIAEGLRNWETKTAYPFTILANGKIAGQIFLENPSTDKGRYELGFFIGKKFWNKGIATKAIIEAVNFGFNNLKLYKIQADNDSDNPASGKTLKKAGFNFEGTRKMSCRKKGKFVDLDLWGKFRLLEQDKGN